MPILIPIEADTTSIVNKGGLSLPTELTGEPVPEFLISADEMAKTPAEHGKCMFRMSYPGLD